MHEDQALRVARNETAFRGLNESIAAGRDVNDDETLVGFLCECGHADCARIIELSPAEYEALRGHPRRFAIVEGHDLPPAEEVVARHERYVVVEKVGTAGAAAESVDPRR